MEPFMCNPIILTETCYVSEEGLFFLHLPKKRYLEVAGVRSINDKVILWHYQ